MAEKVEHSQLMLKQAQSIAHFGSWNIDYFNGLVEWSEECCRIFGLAPCDTMQSYESWVSFIHPDDVNHVLQITREAAKTSSNVAYHHRIKRPDGSVRHIYSQAQYTLNKEGNVVGLNGVAHDITEMKVAETALKQSEANMRLIMDLIPQCIFAKDNTGKFVFTNKNFAALYGRTPKELINRQMRDVMPVQEEATHFLNEDQQIIMSGQPSKTFEHTFTDAQGNVHLFQTLKVPFIVAGTNETAVLGMSVDITEQKQAELERTKMIADIVQRNKDLEQFSYIISHNLRAPVANILGLADIMQIAPLDKEEGEELAGYLATAAKNLDNVILDLNFILQIKEYEIKKKELVKFSDLVRDIKISIAHLLKADNVALTTDFSEADEILSYKSYLYSIFYNLISNSLKYRQSEIPPVVVIKSTKKNNTIQISFKDNGLGIDLEKNGEKIFGLYKRFHGHVDGKGMGLYMVKTQVESFTGGSISVNSEVNQGTEFIIEFQTQTLNNENEK